MSRIFSVVSKRTAGLSCLAASMVLLFGSGCATKKYVKSQTAPLAQKTNELDDQTATNNRNLQNANDTASKGIAQASNQQIRPPRMRNRQPPQRAPRSKALRMPSTVLIRWPASSRIWITTNRLLTPQLPSALTRIR